MQFDQFQSNPTVVQTLKAAVGGRRLSHAYLFHGAAGTGKKTLARIFAQALLCADENAAGRPCGVCLPCLKFSRGVHPDFTVVKKPADRAFLLVEQIRALREELYIRPNESAHRVVLLENAEQMNLPAANALLKVLEEPPPYAIFLLTTDNKDLLPETIASRCVCMELFEVPAPAVKPWLSERFPGVAEDELACAAAYGGGNLGRCEAYLADDAIRRGYEQALTLARALTTGKEYDITAALAPFEGDKNGFLRLLTDFDGILGRISRAPFTAEPDAELAAVIAALSPPRAIGLHDQIDGIRRKLFFNVNCALTVSLFGAQLKEALER